MNVSIASYYGKYEGGVIAILSFVHEDNYYEGTFFYNETKTLLTISDELEQAIGMPVESYIGYLDIIKSILSQMRPYNDIINELNEITL